MNKLAPNLSGKVVYYQASCSKTPSSGLLYMAWTKPQYDRTRINKAGLALLKNGLSDEEQDVELNIVNNWRSAHGYPLHCIKMVLKGRAKSIDSKPIIAQRLKRFPSILAKLKREEEMKLTQMQDIGGCRAILSNIKAINRLVRLYLNAKKKNPKGRHEEIRIKDYIASPKPDGYRGIHLVYKYRSKSKEHEIYNDQKIEIQIRTRLQHAWATAVEIVDTLTGQTLKSGLKLNLGDPKWRRFFVLMSSEIALREGCPIVENSPNTKDELKNELQKLSKELKVVDILLGFSEGFNLGEKLGHTHVDTVAYLLILYLKEKRINVTAYNLAELPAANARYMEIEKETQNDPEVLAVLVAVDSLNALHAAYPNYYLDSSDFIKALKEFTA